MAAKATNLERAILIEALATLCMAWRCEIDHGDTSIQHCQKLLAERSSPHGGDCTRAPITCPRCEADSAYEQAEQISKLLDVMGYVRAPMRHDSVEAGG